MYRIILFAFALSSLSISAAPSPKNWTSRTFDAVQSVVQSKSFAYGAGATTLANLAYLHHKSVKKSFLERLKEAAQKIVSPTDWNQSTIAGKLGILALVASGLTRYKIKQSESHRLTKLLTTKNSHLKPLIWMSNSSLYDNNILGIINTSTNIDNTDFSQAKSHHILVGRPLHKLSKPELQVSIVSPANQFRLLFKTDRVNAIAQYLKFMFQKITAIIQRDTLTKVPLIKSRALNFTNPTCLILPDHLSDTFVDPETFIAMHGIIQKLVEEGIKTIAKQTGKRNLPIATLFTDVSLEMPKKDVRFEDADLTIKDRLCFNIGTRAAKNIIRSLEEAYIFKAEEEQYLEIANRLDTELKKLREEPQVTPS